MTKAPICLQDLRRSLYVKAKAEPTWRFWGLYVHVCKTETLHEAYQTAKKNDGAPGIDGVTFDAIEEGGVESFLQQIKDELVSNTYRPMRVAPTALGIWRTVRPCLTRFPSLTSIRWVSLACSMAMPNPLNRRTRTRLYGGAAGADG
jgi:hypothetical protein